MKQAAGADDAGLTLPVGAPVKGLLRPLGASPARLRPEDVRILTAARNRFVSSFLTEFVATEERTTRWLVEHVGLSDAKILFMYDDVNRIPCGYMGLDFIDWESGRGEADAIVRTGDGPKGFMTEGLRTLMRWAENGLGLRDLSVRVRSDNDALRFYERAGFRQFRAMPLVRHEDAQGTRWIEEPNGDPRGISLIYLRWEG